MTLYGIPNCNTVKKAMSWLQEHKIDFTFHDFKKKGIDKDVLQHWVQENGWEKLVNKKGTTWRMLPKTEQAKVVDAPSAIALMLVKPSVIKRPVIDKNGTFLVGFDAKEFEQQFKK